MSAPAPVWAAAQACAISAQMVGTRPACRRVALARLASCPVGARISTRSSSDASSGLPIAFSNGRLISCQSAENALKFAQGRTDANAAGLEFQFSDGQFMPAAALVQNRDGLADEASTLKIAKENHGICKIADIDRCAYLGADQAGLAHHQNGDDPFLRKKGQELMQLRGEELLFRHGIE